MRITGHSNISLRIGCREVDLHTVQENREKSKRRYHGALNSSELRSILIVHTFIMAFSQENARVIVQSGQSELSVMISSRHFVIRDIPEMISELAEPTPGYLCRDQEES